MKKIMAVMLSLLACTVLLAGCNTSSESNEEQSLKVYSFSGENEYISVSNGVIILDGKDEICYGGDLKVMSDDFANITTSSGKQYGGSRMGKYREVCFLGNHVIQRISSNICCWKKV